MAVVIDGSGGLRLAYQLKTGEWVPEPRPWWCVGGVFYGRQITAPAGLTFGTYEDAAAWSLRAMRAARGS